MTDGEIARLVNDLTAVAREYGHTQQLRCRISELVNVAVRPPRTVCGQCGEAVTQACGPLGKCLMAAVWPR